VVAHNVTARGAREDAATAAQRRPAPKVPPETVVATEPTALIATDGQPHWKSLTGGKILYVENTETPWLRQFETGNMYVLLSGRWYRSKSTSGSCTLVPPSRKLTFSQCIL
jgi:hypothetical protein